MEGYIKLSRKFFSNDMWNEARTFSSCEAWLDLIQSARFEATPRKESIGGREVSYTRGQYPASIRFLSQRWKWSEKKVRSFMKRLKKEGMITVECSQGMNLITLCKYEEYNPLGTIKGTVEGTDICKKINELQTEWAQLKAQIMAQADNMGHTEGTNTKKGKNIIKETTTNVVAKKNAAKAATLSRKDSFYQSLIPFVGQYPKEMIRAFYDYWSELNKSETKMRYELEKTWELPLRLKTWSNKERKTYNDYERNRRNSQERKSDSVAAISTTCLAEARKRREELEAEGVIEKIPNP